jgi:hypothetical protein
LQRKLLRYLLARPELAVALTTDNRTALAELAERETFADIVNYVANNPGVDQSDIVGRWAGHAVQSQLLQLLEQPLTMDPLGLEGEFHEGIGRYVELVRRDDRRALLARLRSDPSTETLRELWSKTKQDAAASLGGRDSESDQATAESAVQTGALKGTPKP